jgi:hypothetical protein
MNGTDAGLIRRESAVSSGTLPFGIAVRESWWVAGLSSVLVILLQIPYLLGYTTAPANSIYTGLLINVEDANYITIIQRGSEGAWTHSLRFTSEPDVPAFLYVFYLAWGHLAGLLHIEATMMWHIVRIVMTVVTFAVGFGFVNLFVQTRAQRTVAYLLAILGAGFDWFALPRETLAATSATPVDLKMADAHLFSAALTFPHYLGSITLLTLLFWCVIRLFAADGAQAKLPRGKIALLVVGGALANIGVALVYPFFVILSCGVLAFYVFLLMVQAHKILWRKIWIVVALIVPVIPLALYYAFTLAASELLRVWAAQSQTLSPNPLHYVLTFAPYLILAALELWRAAKHGTRAELHPERRVLLWAWVVVVAVLVYAPLGAQRRFLQGVQIPLAILATLGWFEVVLPRVMQARWFQSLAQRPNYSAQGLVRLLGVVLIVCLALSSAYQWLSAVAETVIAQPYPLFRPRGEVEAMDWLRGTAHPDDVILSSYFSGSYLPYRSGARVYLGHYYETIHFQEKERNVDNFFQSTTDDSARTRFLSENQIRYVFYGQAEQALGKFEPQRASYLDPIFENADAAVYAVRIP